MVFPQLCMMCSLLLKPSCHVEVVGAKEETKKDSRRSSKPTEIQNLLHFVCFDGVDVYNICKAWWLRRLKYELGPKLS